MYRLDAYSYCVYWAYSVVGSKMNVRVRGDLVFLHVLPGCGKTLMARQIGNMLHAREPKVVNGPGKVHVCTL